MLGSPKSHPLDPEKGATRVTRHCTNCGEGFLGYPEPKLCQVCTDAGFEFTGEDEDDSPVEGEVHAADATHPMQDPPRPESPAEATDALQNKLMGIIRSTNILTDIQTCLKEAYQDGYRDGQNALPEGDAFTKKLAALINSHSRENISDTPDFILAEAADDILSIVEQVITRREEWYGRSTSEPVEPPTDA